MAERKYSVSEIDTMRHSVEMLLDFRGDAKAVEERLRTYMLNGTEPEELKEAGDKALAQAQQSRIAAQEMWAKMDAAAKGVNGAFR